MTKEQECKELHNTIWKIANDLRGSVDGWDFKSYVLGILFYRFISENLTDYINKEEQRTAIDEIVADLLITRYVYYTLLIQENILVSKVRVAGIPTLDASAVEKLIIPIPPHLIQQQIVTILDSFTKLEARRKQYEYYRVRLLDFTPLKK